MSSFCLKTPKIGKQKAVYQFQNKVVPAVGCIQKELMTEFAVPMSQATFIKASVELASHAWT